MSDATILHGALRLEMDFGTGNLWWRLRGLPYPLDGLPMGRDTFEARDSLRELNVRRLGLGLPPVVVRDWYVPAPQV